MEPEKKNEEEKIQHKPKKTYSDVIESIYYDHMPKSQRKEKTEEEWEDFYTQEHLHYYATGFTNIPPSDLNAFFLWEKYQKKLRKKCSEFDHWKEFFHTIKADHIFYVVDGRDYEFFYEPDILKPFDHRSWSEFYDINPELYINEYKLTVIVNKSDLINEEVKKACRKKFKNVIFYSNTSQKKDENPILKFIEESNDYTFGMIGYPTVGKSSIIKNLMNQTTSSKLEKSKYSETLWIGEKKIINCQGIIFPRHSLKDLCSRRLLSVKTLAPEDYFPFVIEILGISTILDFFECKNFKCKNKLKLKENLFIAIYKKTGLTKDKAMNKIWEVYFENKLKMSEKLEIEKGINWERKK